MKFQDKPEPQFLMTIAPFPTLEGNGLPSNTITTFNAERTSYYRHVLSQLFAFVGIAHKHSSYDEMAIQTIEMYRSRRCGMCKEHDPYTYAVVGSPDIAVVAICEACYSDRNHPKWVLFPPTNS